MNYYFQAFKKYADFSGRASKKEFWMFFLFNSIAIFSLYFLIGIAVLMANISSYGRSSNGVSLFLILLLCLYALATFIPSLAITIRRLRDAGESSWMILVSLIPFAGAIWLIVLLCKDSVVATKEYDINLNNAKNETYATITSPSLCPNCNSPIDTDTVFCEICGNKIK